MVTSSSRARPVSGMETMEGPQILGIAGGLGPGFAGRAVQVSLRAATQEKYRPIRR